MDFWQLSYCHTKDLDPDIIKENYDSQVEWWGMEEGEKKISKSFEELLQTIVDWCVDDGWWLEYVGNKGADSCTVENLHNFDSQKLNY